MPLNWTLENGQDVISISCGFFFFFFFLTTIKKREKEEEKPSQMAPGPPGAPPLETQHTPSLSEVDTPRTRGRGQWRKDLFPGSR